MKGRWCCYGCSSCRRRRRLPMVMMVVRGVWLEGSSEGKDCDVDGIEMDSDSDNKNKGMYGEGIEGFVK